MVEMQNTSVWLDHGMLDRSRDAWNAKHYWENCLISWVTWLLWYNYSGSTATGWIRRHWHDRDMTGYGTLCKGYPQNELYPGKQDIKLESIRVTLWRVLSIS